MKDYLDFAELHKRLVSHTEAHFAPEGVKVCTYERFEEGKLPSPLILYHLESAPEENEDEALGTGQMLTGLRLSAYVVVDGLTEGAALTVRKLALRLKHFLYRNNFGMGLEWPQVGDAEDAEFDWPKVLSNCESFEIWRVGFAYKNVILGESSWK